MTSTNPSPKRTRRLAHRYLLLLTLTLILSPLLGPRSAHAADNSITSPDTYARGGEFASLVLDSNGYPVISYHEAFDGDLRLVHCNDANCAGGDESITLPVNRYVGVDGMYTSLVLDANGYPVVSYESPSGGGLSLLHCNDANCAGAAESFTVPEHNRFVGTTSLVLDANGYPVISYYETFNGDLKLMHCNDANCAGDNESISIADATDNVGEFNSLVLDGSGYPIVSYYDATNGDLKVLHCNDANCTGSDESMMTPDTTGNVGQYTSLALDSNGYPVVSYYDATNGDIKLLHCNDANCAGGNESITNPDTIGDVGQYTSLVLDGNGYPVVSYLASHYDPANFDLKVMHCNDANCAGGDDPVPTTDRDTFLSSYTSLALDANGYPVVGYWSKLDLSVLHCGSSTCQMDTIAPVINTNVVGTPSNNGWYVSDVTVNFTCADEGGGSGLATNTVAGATLTTDGANQSVTNTGACRDQEGNLAAPVTVSGLNLDRTPPTLNPVVSPNPMQPGAAASVTSGATDGISGLASQSCGALDTSTPGSKSVTCTATDNAGNTASATVQYTVLAPLTLRQQVQTVRTTLATFVPSGDKKNDERFNNALRKLDQALATKLWQADGNHLTLSGDDVFNRLQDAVQELAKLKQPPANVRALTTTLVGISRSLAQLALDEASSGGVSASKLAKARSKLSKGDSEAAKGKAATAIANYEDAWEYTQQACGRAVVASADADELNLDDTSEPSDSDPEALPFHLFLPVINR